MELSDYEDPNDPYAPRPDASKQTAAKHRQRARHDDPDPAQPIRLPASTRRYVPFGIGAAVLVLLMIGAASYQLGRLPQGRPLAITPVPTEAAYVAAPTTPPAPTSAPTALPRTIGAYAAPDGLLLGQIEVDRQITPVAHYGSGWIQADVLGSGLVWLRAGDVPDVALTGPDLAPAQTGRGLTVDQGSGGWAPPEATPESPAPLAEPTATPITEWPTSASASAADFEKSDIQDRCKFITCLGQQAVDLARAQACHALYWQYGDADSEAISEPDLSAVRGCVWEGLYK